MFRSKLIGLTAIMALLASVSSVKPALAQAVYGSILGTITDPQGASVKGAKVTVTSQSKGTSEETTSNDDGNYSATHLLAGLYSLRVEAPGFKIAEPKDVLFLSTPVLVRTCSYSLAVQPKPWRLRRRLHN